MDKATKVLVTGADGFIGTRLLTRLASKAGLMAVAGVRGRAAEVPERVEVASIGDLTRGDNLQAALGGVSTVVHLAARVHVMRETAADPLLEFRRTNVQSTVHLAREAVAAGVRRFVYLSSIKVNGECTAQGRAFAASDPARPADPYAVSKYEAEGLLGDVAAGAGLETVIIRPPVVYGPGVGGNFARLMRLVRQGLPLPFGGIRNRRSMIALDNLVDLIVNCISAPQAAGRVFLASDGADMSTPELVRMLATAMGKPARLVNVSETVLRRLGTLAGKGDEVRRLCDSLEIDIAETRSVLQWEPPLTVDEGLRQAVDAFLRAGKH